MEDCIFCKIVAKEIPCIPLYENRNVLCFLDIAPATEGHALVIPKVHFTNIFDVDEEFLLPIMKVVQSMAAHIKGKLRAEGVNILQSNGHAAGQVVDHLHFHIIPRWADDGQNLNWKHYEITTDELEEIADQIGVVDF